MALLTNIDNKFSVSDAGAVRFNNAFTFPTADGTANYVLKTNGSGQLAWAPDLNSDAVTKIIGGTNITVSPATGLGDVTVNADLSGTVTGSGTLNKVPRWTATGSDLGDGPITFSNASATATSTFGGPVTSASVYGTSRVQSDDNMFMVGGQFYMGAGDSSTDDTYRFYAASGVYYLQSRKSGTWTTYLSIGSDAHAAFSGQVSATHFDSTSTTANIFLGSVITKPGDNLGFIVRNSSNTIIGSFLRTSNTTSKLTTDNLALGGTTAQYVRGDGSFATFSPGTGTVTGSGSASRVAFWTTTSNISYNDDFKYDGFRKIALGGDIENSLSDFCSIELGNTGMIMSEKADSQYNALFLSNNAYYTDAWRYKTASVVGANYISLYQGKILFATAPAPTTAGDAITWSTKMTLLNNGNFGIGTDSPPSDHRLQIHNAGAAYSRFALTNSSTGVASGDGLIFQMETLNSIIKNQENGSLAFGTNGRETDLYINSSGSINIGSRRAALPSNFGYSSSYKVLILGSSGANYQTDAVTLSLGVDITGNPSGAYNGNGREIIIRNEGSFISPNAANNGYNSILSWNSSGQPYFSQNVGIGTTGPSANLEVKTLTGGAGVNTLRLNTNFANGNAVDINPFITGANNGGLEIKLNGAQKLVMLPSGNVGIGTTSPSGYKLVIENTAEDMLKLHNSTDGLDSLISFTNPGGTLARIQGLDNGGLQFDTGNNAGGVNTNVMYMSNGGKVGIGTTSPTYKLVVSNSGAEGLEIAPGYTSGANLLQNYNRSNSQYVRADYVASTHQWYQGDTSTVNVHMDLTGSGVLTVKNDIVAYGSPSDKRLKENIKPIESALDKVSKLQGVTFDWKESDSILKIKKDIGFIASSNIGAIP